MHVKIQIRSHRMCVSFICIFHLRRRENWHQLTCTCCSTARCHSKFSSSLVAISTGSTIFSSFPPQPFSELSLSLAMSLLTTKFEANIKSGNELGVVVQWRGPAKKKKKKEAVGTLSIHCMCILCTHYYPQTVYKILTSYHLTKVILFIIYIACIHTL